jgi:hypothetical protein
MMNTLCDYTKTISLTQYLLMLKSAISYMFRIYQNIIRILGDIVPLGIAYNYGVFFKLQTNLCRSNILVIYSVPQNVSADQHSCVCRLIQHLVYIVRMERGYRYP